MDHGVQEFDLATRTSDAAAQLAVLERCQALPQFLPEHFCKLAAQAEAAGGGGSHSAAGKAAIAAALRLMLRQAPQPYPAIAQVAACYLPANMLVHGDPAPAWPDMLHPVRMCCGIRWLNVTDAQRSLRVDQPTFVLLADHAAADRAVRPGRGEAERIQGRSSAAQGAWCHEAGRSCRQAYIMPGSNRGMKW